MKIRSSTDTLLITLATAFATYREEMTNKVIADDELTQSEGA